MLKRYWYSWIGNVSDPALPWLGCGVTADNPADATSFIERDVLRGRALRQPHRIIENVQLGQLDLRHVIPGIGEPEWPGVWFPSWNCPTLVDFVQPSEGRPAHWFAVSFAVTFPAIVRGCIRSRSWGFRGCVATFADRWQLVIERITRQVLKPPLPHVIAIDEADSYDHLVHMHMERCACPLYVLRPGKRETKGKKHH